MAFKISNTETKNSYSMHVQGDAEGINLHIVDGTTKGEETPVRAVMNSVGKTASKVITSARDLLSAPGTWLKDMQQNWFSYMVVIAIIFGSAALLYCALSIYCHRKKNSKVQSQFMELSKIFANKITHSPRSPALPTKFASVLPSLESNLQV
ncbi:unnamed protein product [Adineta ricciae]|uniref:Uncharacterized protein n=1 Tax=Adineta ricciae TaxID=249248 RepID=A0A814REG5_ADIRI|nr:unnamed protein product [Adineta ricciae]CAF1440728.1 unnamed protein product [Adineta ricciae]